MDLITLRKLVRLLERSTIGEIEIEEEGLRIRVAKPGAGPAVQTVVPAQAPAVQVLPAATPHPGASSEAAAPVPAVAPAVRYHEVRSPIVGTFYRAPAPDADPYIEVGQVIQPKTVLCIIEAMKLMNEIESDVAGRVVKIMVENGQPVEYNQVLFQIEPM